MPAQARRAKQQALITRLALRIMRETADNYRAGEDIRDVLIGMAVALGQTENKLMTSGKVAQYLGMPRTTILRRVQALIERGGLMQHPETKLLILPDPTLTDREALKRTARLKHIIMETAEALSKLDT